MQCTANSAGECHLDVVEVEGSNPPPCKQKGNPKGLPFLFIWHYGGLKRSVSRSRAGAGFCSEGGMEPDYREA